MEIYDDRKIETNFLLRPTFLLTVFSLILVTLGVLLLYRGGFREEPIRNLEVRGNQYYTDDEIFQMLGIEHPLEDGQPLRNVVLEEAVGRLKKNRVILNTSIKDDGNGRYILTVQERRCAAIIRNNERLYDVDDELMILSDQDVRCTNVPIISGAFMESNGKFDHALLLEVVGEFARLKSRFAPLFARFSEIRISRDETMDIYLKRTRIKIRLGGAFNSQTLLKVETALSYFEKTGAKSGLIDLRGPDAILIPES